MKKYGNILIARRMVISLLLCVCALVVLMPGQIVKADSVSNNNGNRYSGTIDNSYANAGDDDRYHESVMYICDSDNPVYTFAIKFATSNLQVGVVSASEIKMYSSSYYTDFGYSSMTKVTDNYFVSTCGAYHSTFSYGRNTKYKHPKVNIYLDCDKHNDLLNGDAAYKYIKDYVSGNNGGEKLDIDLDAGHYSPASKQYKEIGSLKNVRVDTVQDINSIVDVEGNSDLADVKQDKVIVYDSTSSTGIDLSKGGYKVQLYGSFAYQSRDGDIIHEDKGTKTFIKDWNAENNIRKSGKYTYIDWPGANKIVDAGKSKNATKPSKAELWTKLNHMYQFEPIWYLRIVSSDNKYGPWVRVERTSGGKYKVDSVDDNDNPVRDDDGGYKKPDSNSEVVSGGDGLDDAKDKVPKAEEKQDEDDKDEITSGNNSTFDKLEQFTQGIGDVPKMIADIFSFLPSWCLEVVAIGFALLMILIVVKFIRG